MAVITTLRPQQKKVLDEFKKERKLTKIFYLTGGTALAEFYLKHRQSIDLDLFTDSDFPLELATEFINKVKKKLKAEVTFETLFNRRIFYLQIIKEEVRIEFTKYPFTRLGKLNIFDGLLVDDKFDIAVNKLFAIFDRNEAKDFIDLYFLLQQFKLNQLVDGVEKKFGFKIEPLTLGSEFIKSRKIAAFPKMIKKLTKKEVIDFFEKEAGKLGNEIFL